MRPCIVLVRPARPANVGAAARAMKNFGLDDLRLVASRTGLPGESGHSEARALAWNAADVLESARVFDTIQDAVADLALPAAASARPGPPRDTVAPREWAAEVARLPEGARAGCVFGPEDHGLPNEELDACRVRLRIPSSGEQPSLNLGQAVVVVAYELSCARPSPSSDAPEPEREADVAAPAREEEVERLVQAGRDLLLRAGYLNPQAPEHVLGELRRLLARARPDRREVTLLQGLVAQLDWACRQAR